MKQQPSVNKETYKRLRRPAIKMLLWLYDSIDYVIDTETTGLKTTEDEVLHLGVVELKTKKVIVDQWLLPTVPISKGAARVHHITNETLEQNGAVPLDPKMYNSISDTLKDKVVAGFNVPFDAAMLDNQCLRLGFDTLPVAEWVDVMHVLNTIHGLWNTGRAGFAWQKLATFNIENRQLHNAVSDCLIVADYMNYIVNKIRGEGHNE